MEKKTTHHQNMIPLIHTHDCVLYWLGTDTAIKSGEDKLVFGPKPPLLECDLVTQISLSRYNIPPPPPSNLRN